MKITELLLTIECCKLQDASLKIIISFGLRATDLWFKERLLLGEYLRLKP